MYFLEREYTDCINWTSGALDDTDVRRNLTFEVAANSQIVLEYEQMTVVFVSDGSITFDGFSMVMKAVNTSDPGKG